MYETIESKTKKTSTLILSIDIILIFIVSFILFFLFLESYPLISPDEGRYAEVAREMLYTHNYITPTLNGVVFLDKPPLYFWISAFIMHLGGVHEWSARFVSTLFGFFGLVGIYLTGYALYGRRTGLIAAAILISMPLYFLSAHFANCDLLVAVCITLSLFGALIAIVYPESRYRRLYVYFAYICCGLAILAKGLMGIILPAFIIGLFILFCKQWSLIKRMHLLSGLCIVLAITLPWFILVSRENNSFLYYFFYVQHFQRFVSQDFNDQHWFGFYLPIVVMGAWPWCLYLYDGIRNAYNKVLDKQESQIDYFLIIWVLATLVFFSIPASKSVGYILPVFPPLALLIARYFSHSTTKMFNVPVLINLVTIFAVGILFMVYPHLLRVPVDRKLSAILGMALVIIGFSCVFVYRRYKQPIYVIMVINLTLLLCILGLGYIKTSDSAEKVAMWLRLRNVAPPSIYLYQSYPFEAPYYLRSPLNVVFPNWQDPALVKDDSWYGEFALGLRETHHVVPYFVNADQFMMHWQANQAIYVIVPDHLILPFEERVGSSHIIKLFHDKTWWIMTNTAGEKKLMNNLNQPNNNTYQ